MKVLTLTGKDYFGAGRAALRLHEGLSELGVECRMYVGDKRSANKSVTNIYPSAIQKGVIKIYRNLEDRTLKKYPEHHQGMFSAGRYGMNPLKAIQAFNPDIVHLHWINRGFMGLNYLSKIKVPIVISLHDMWTFTGGCHYDELCGGFKKQCGNCLYLASTNPNDASKKIFDYKKQIFNKTANLSVIGLSKWMADEARASTLLDGKKVFNLPNGINTNEFRPHNVDDFKRKVGIETHRKLILFGAIDALDEPRKGFVYLREALKQLDSDKHELLIIGGGTKRFEIEKFKVHNIGSIADDELLINYLSAADVAVVPSLQENLSNVIMESLACATPVVAFNIGGNGDMIKHQENGYLCELNAQSLANGIMWCSDEQHNETLKVNARQSVIDSFDIKKVSQQYLNLYNELLT